MYVPRPWRTEQQDQHFAISFSGLYAFPVDPDGNAELAEFWALPGWAVCSPRQLATNCRLARELACRIYTVPWLIKAVKPGLLHRLGTGQGPAILQASPSAVGEGQGAWRALHGWDITVPQLQNSSTRNSRTHLYVLFPRNHADPLRRQLRICQEDGKVRYAARALTDSPTAKDFPYRGPYRGGDTRWRHWWSFCSFALTIMYWFALRNLPCFIFCATLMGPFLHKGIRLSLL